MKTKHLKLAALALLPVAILIFAACSTSTVPGEQTSAMATSSTSTTFVDTFQATARVTAVDASSRKVKLALENGKPITVKCGPEVANFNQIHINDVVKVTVTEELSGYLDKGAKMGMSGHAAGELAPIGAKPGGAMTDTLQETLKIASIDKKNRTITFVAKDGIRETIRVRGHIDLSKAKVGDTVTISHTMGVAVSVEKA
jgi:hypothetical protein